MSGAVEVAEAGLRERLAGRAARVQHRHGILSEYFASKQSNSNPRSVLTLEMDTRRTMRTMRSRLSELTQPLFSWMSPPITITCGAGTSQTRGAGSAAPH